MPKRKRNFNFILVLSFVGLGISLGVFRNSIYEYWLGYRIIWFDENDNIKDVSDNGNVLIQRIIEEEDSKNTNLNSQNKSRVVWGSGVASTYTVEHFLFDGNDRSLNKIDNKNKFLFLQKLDSKGQPISAVRLKQLSSKARLNKLPNFIDINALGEIAGYFQPNDDSVVAPHHAFVLTRDGEFVDLHAQLNAKESEAQLINSKGWVSGKYTDAVSGEEFEFLWKDEKVETTFVKTNNIPVPVIVPAVPSPNPPPVPVLDPHCVLVDMNDRGQVLMNCSQPEMSLEYIKVWGGNNKSFSFPETDRAISSEGLAIDSKGRVLIRVQRRLGEFEYYLSDRVRPLDEIQSFPEIHPLPIPEAKGTIHYTGMSPSGNWLRGELIDGQGKVSRQFILKRLR